MFFTGKGDDGTTGLLGEGRVQKYDRRMEALGALDEANAALGLARSLMGDIPETALVLEIQRQLYQLMTEIAATPENAARFQKIDEGSVLMLEKQIAALSKRIVMPSEFIVPGDSPASAAFSLARTVVRRAERRVVELADCGMVANRSLIAFLNRLSSLLFVLEIDILQQTGQQRPTLAKGD
ncbi:MAG: cob(I)yrinic acid a,c-diamide adenosyltransferase [Chloroflexi bacterium]|nr:ATP:cob(I)alamin adenosyltransferase [Anaerolinea sp.]TDA65209.1 MAG: cob(I)yrinic acid a,c-diamide adenosyltransferase [Chloroflexota bacterium]